MPEVRNCKKCGKIFSYLGGQPLCPACRDKDEEDFKRVKEYLYENPGATLSEVSNVLDISVGKIKRFLKEGRLEIVGEGGNVILECENCGKSIKSGRLCEECERELANELKSAARTMSERISQSQQYARKSSELRYLSIEEQKRRAERDKQ